MKISIIIPVYKEKYIYHIINHIEKFNYDKYEIIIVDCVTKSKISEINSKNDNIITLVSEKGRANQMNKGTEIATGEILLFLHADTYLPENGLIKINELLENNQNIVGGAFNLKFDSDNLFMKIISFFTNIRTKITKIPYGDQAIFVRKNIFNKLNGYKQIPILEDVDLMERLKKNNYKIKILNDYVTTSSRKWKKQGYLKTTLKNRLIMLLYVLGVSLKKIKKLS